jgi:hypothetical protein
MNGQALVFDTFFLSGGRLDRLRQALQAAVDQARVAQDSGHGRNVEDALTEIEETIAAQLCRIDNAVDDDKADAEESGEAERARRSWFSRYRAA